MSHFKRESSPFSQEMNAVYIAETSATVDNSPSKDKEVQLLNDAGHLGRQVGSRQLQLITIGGSIGTALFVSIGTGLMRGGPGSLFLAYTSYCLLLGLVNNCIAEMVVFMPVPGSFLRMAGHWVDEAFGFMAGWNYFLYTASLVPFEISAVNLVLEFWRDDIPVTAVCAVCVFSYCAMNIFAVRYYSEAEFWLSWGKVLLIMMLFSFTFVTMVGGNPQHDAYGFRYWRDPGSFAEYIKTGSLGQFEGFLAALWSASFTIVGPEVPAMLAGETVQPRAHLKTAFKTMYWRFGNFFIAGALCVGIVLPYNDPTLIGVLTGKRAGASTAAASPYVIAMQNMGIHALPDITNALLVSSIYSAGNSDMFNATRALYGLALAGQAPQLLRKCTKAGVPIYCVLVTSIFPLLSFLAVSSSTESVITWFVNLTEAAQLINYIVMSTTYIFFYRALKAQGIDRQKLPYVGWFQPYCAWIGLVFMALILGCYGYATFLPGRWDVGTFFSYYTMVFLAPLTFSGWKIWKRSKFVRASDADLVWDKPAIDAYEESLAKEEKKVFFQKARKLPSRIQK